MKNAAIIRAYGKRAKYRRQLAVVQRQVARLEKLGRLLDTKISVLADVTEIADGVALCIATNTRRYWVRAAGDDILRSAEVYTNVPTQKDFGLTLSADEYPRKEYWEGVGLRWGEAVARARRWVIRGERHVEPSKPSAPPQRRSRGTTRAARHR